MRVICALLFFLPFLALSGVPGVSGVYTYSDLNKLKSQINRTEIEKIARKAEEEFHKILNAHRKQLGRNPLEWLDLHWVAAVNHNNWMVENNQLSHRQIQNTAFFSGNSPSDRVRFVNDQNLIVSYSGENCLYNWANFLSGSINEKAQKLARLLFEQWKSSPGHYANMIGNQHQGHGAAFYIESNGKVWGTQKFGSFQNKPSSLADIRHNDVVRYRAQGFEDNTLIIRDPASNQFDQSARLTSGIIRRELEKELDMWAKSQKLLSRRYLLKAADKHANYLATYRAFGERQQKGRDQFYGETLRDRLNKASFFMSAITGNSKRAKEASVTMHYNNSILSMEKILEDIQLALDKQLETNYRNWGYGVRVRKRQTTFSVTVVKVVVP
jgi:uncharacterized protein YkwD